MPVGLGERLPDVSDTTLALEVNALPAYAYSITISVIAFHNRSALLHAGPP